MNTQLKAMKGILNLKRGCMVNFFFWTVQGGNEYGFTQFYVLESAETMNQLVLSQNIEVPIIDIFYQ